MRDQSNDFEARRSDARLRMCAHRRQCSIRLGNIARSDFIYWLVRLLWITQGWGAREGIWNLEALLLVVENVALFGVLGVIAALLARVPSLYLALGACVVAESTLRTLFASSGSTEYGPWLALFAALAVWSVPFAVVWHWRQVGETTAVGRGRRTRG